MKKFIKHLVLFSIPLVVLMVLADIFISSEMSKSHRSPGEIEVWNAIYNGGISTDIAIYGSSRAWVHFSSEIIAEKTGRATYNFGMDGQNFDLQYLRHSEYIANNPEPKVIVLSLDVFSIMAKKELYEADQFLPYMLGNSLLRHKLDKYNYFHIADFYVPLLRYTGRNKSLKEIAVNSLQQRDTLGNFRTLGYRGVDREWNDDLQKARLQNPAFSIKVDSGIKTLLEAFITECKSKDITLIFVYTPEYIEGQRFVKNREEIINYYEALALKNDIPLLDYSAHAISSDRANFYNTSHLNKVGSSRFSEIFSDELVELLYQTE